MKIGIAGVGVMGRPMAVNILAAGFELWAYDPDEEAVAYLVDRGAHGADSVDVLSRAVDVAILMLPSLDVIREVGSEILHAEASVHTLIDMSTSDPAVDEELAEQASAVGISYLDAPVSRAVQAAWDGNLLILVGGDEETLSRCRPVFEAVGSDIEHCGPVGSGHKMKLLNNLKIMAEVDLITEIMRLARKAGMDLDVVNAVIGKSSAQSFMWDYQAPRMVSGDYTPGFSIKMGHKDLSLGVGWAEREGLRLPLATTSMETFARGVERGFGDLDTAALVSDELDRS